MKVNIEVLKKRNDGSPIEIKLNGEIFILKEPDLFIEDEKKWIRKKGEEIGALTELSFH
jgi:hypothetical protein